MITPQSSSAFSPGGFLSAGKAKPASTAKNNTFVYRSPAAMARFATPATVSSPLPATSGRAAGSAVTAGKSTAGRSADEGSVRFSPEVAFIVVDEVRSALLLRAVSQPFLNALEIKADGALFC
jgi:hypothetical protein